MGSKSFTYKYNNIIHIYIMSRIEFKESAIKLRSFLTPSQIEARDIKQFGQKVQLSEKTLKALATEIDVPDPLDTNFLAEGRPQRTVKKRVNAADAALSVKDTISALNTLVTKQGAAGIQATTALGARIGSLITDKFDEIADLSDEQFKILQEAISKVGIQKNPIAAGFSSPLVLSLADIRDNRNLIIMYAFSNLGFISIPSADGVQRVSGTLDAAKQFYSVRVNNAGFATIKPRGMRFFANVKDIKRRYIDLNYLALVPFGKQFDATGILRNSLIAPPDPDIRDAIPE